MRSCLIVGAGMAGLTAARELESQGFAVTIFDKGRGVGGRMATRLIGESRFDYGAQFFTVRSPEFRDAVSEWEREGLVAPWFEEGGHVRYRAVNGMNALAKHLARPFVIHTECKVTGIEPAWKATVQSGEIVESDALILTAPAPQALALLPSMAATLSRVEFDPCFALMLVLDGPSGVPEPGYVRPRSGPVEWIADNERKGISVTPALTIHATADFTREYLDAPHEEVARLLLNAAQPWLGGGVTEFQLHRWLYSKPLPLETQPRLHAGTLAIAGDAFCGGRVEGAFLSGLAAAKAIGDKLNAIT
jgi:predicted NAD/FAD-dependent oxidoreductase